MAKPKTYIAGTSALSVLEVGDLFENSMKKGIVGGMLKGRTEFSAPTETPFSDAVPEHQRHDLAVVADVPTSRNNSSIVHLYASEIDVGCSFEVMGYGGMLSVGVAVKRLTGKFVDSLADVDPSLQLEYR